MIELEKNYNAELTTAKLPAYEPVIKPGTMDRVAHYVSLLSSPPLLAAIGILTAAQAMEGNLIWAWTGAFVTLSVIPPVLYIMWLIQAGKVTNFHLDVRKQRKGPLILILLNTLLVMMVLVVGGAPHLLLLISIAGMVLVGLIYLITLRWKISAHCACASALAVLNCILFGQQAVGFAALVPVIAWSRIQLGKHTLAQTIFGALLGGAVFAMAFTCTGV